MKNKLILVAGGGGFIGGHLVAHFREQGYDRIRSVDVKPLDQWYQVFDDVENVQADLKLRDACRAACRGVGEVYNLAADMGGMGFIENNKALCMLSVLINTHLLQAAQEAKVDRYFYASSACVYNADKQRGRLRLGKAVQRADVPAFPGGLRRDDPRRPVS
jgi:nucleoside-diphosphate-sugar epimerase